MYKTAINVLDHDTASDKLLAKAFKPAPVARLHIGYVERKFRLRAEAHYFLCELIACGAQHRRLHRDYGQASFTMAERYISGHRIMIGLPLDFQPSLIELVGCLRHFTA